LDFADPCVVGQSQWYAPKSENKDQLPKKVRTQTIGSFDETSQLEN